MIGRPGPGQSEDIAREVMNMNALDYFIRIVMVYCQLTRNDSL